MNTQLWPPVPSPQSRAVHETNTVEFLSVHHVISQLGLGKLTKEQMLGILYVVYYHNDVQLSKASIFFVKKKSILCGKFLTKSIFQPRARGECKHEKPKKKVDGSRGWMFSLCLIVCKEHVQFGKIIGGTARARQTLSEVCTLRISKGSASAHWATFPFCMPKWNSTQKQRKGSLSCKHLLCVRCNLPLTVIS